MNKPLSYEAKKILAAYKEFYGEEYDGNCENEDNLKTHIKAQKMVYLLSSSGIYMGEFGFSWHTNGPYSAELQHDLKSLDQQRNIIKKFYLNEATSILKGSESNFIKDFKGMTVDRIPAECEVNIWIELIASILFVKRIVMPHENNDAINKEVEKRNKKLMTNTPIERAWDTLTLFENQRYYVGT